MLFLVSIFKLAYCLYIAECDPGANNVVFLLTGDRTAELAPNLKVIDVDNSFCRV